MANRTRAAVMGATGAVGSQVVAGLLRSQAFDVTTLGRRALGTPGVTEHIVDVGRPESYEPLLDGQACAFCTLGIGQASKVSRDELWRVDFQANLEFAAACRRAGVRHFSLMTSVGANPRSPFDYLKLKGKLEDDVQALGFPRLSIFRPSMLLTPANRYGLMQGITLAVWPKLDLLLSGPLRRFRGVRVEDLGEAMARNALRPGAGAEIFEWDQFSKLLRA
jgi:uncharacterized protein YbjT (DUF2867 family)